MQLTDTPRAVETTLGLIQHLGAVAAPSGHEDAMVEVVTDLAERAGFEPEVDRIGNVVVPVAGASAGAPLIVAHLDELGLVVRDVDAGGFIKVDRLGGVPERVLPGTRVVVHGRLGDVAAVVGLKAHHLTPPEEKYVARPVEHLYLDAGFGSRTDAEHAGVRVGDPVTYAPSFAELAGGRVCGKSMDDRVAVAVLLRLLRRFAERPPEPLLVGFSVQEEFNVRGTLAVAERWQPRIAVQVDVAPACDPPDLRDHGPVRLGGGPVLTRMSFHGRGTLGGLVPHPSVLRALERAAVEARVPLQYQSIVGLITDAAFLPMSGAAGVAVAEVAIPCRYTHSPVELVDLKDVEATIELLDVFARRTAFDLRRGAVQLRQGELP